MDVNKAFVQEHPQQSEIKIELIAGCGNIRSRDKRTLVFQKDSFTKLQEIAEKYNKHGSKVLQSNRYITSFDEAFKLIEYEIQTQI